MKKIIVHTDGGSRGNPGPCGAGVFITDGTGTVLKEIAEFLGNGTNNFAEYQAVIVALQALQKILGKKSKETEVEIKLDSELVQRQLSHQYQIKEPNLVPQFMAIHNMRVAHFPHLKFTHVRREHNKEADRLANEAMDAMTN